MKFDNKIIVKHLLGSGLCEAESEIKFHCIYSDDREIYRIQCSNANYIFKTVGTSRKSTDEFEIEFKLLNKIWNSTKGLCSMPQPLLLVDEGLLMTECDGEPLKDKYYKSLYQVQGRRNIIKSFDLSAKWLAEFHSCTLIEGGYADAYANRNEHLLRMTDSINSADVSASVKSVLADVMSYFNKVNDVDVTLMCQLHGNFALRNILYNDSEISLIDFEDSKYDCVYYDLGMFVSELMNKSILLFNKGYNERLIKTFISAYKIKESLSLPMLNSYILYHLVCSYYDVVNRSVPSSFVKRIVLQYKKKYTFYLIQSFLSKV